MQWSSSDANLGRAVAARARDPFFLTLRMPDSTATMSHNTAETRALRWEWGDA
jgi:hypothetical protein